MDKHVRLKEDQDSNPWPSNVFYLTVVFQKIAKIIFIGWRGLLIYIYIYIYFFFLFLFDFKTVCFRKRKCSRSSLEMHDHLYTSKRGTLWYFFDLVIPSAAYTRSFLTCFSHHCEQSNFWEPILWEYDCPLTIQPASYSAYVTEHNLRSVKLLTSIKVGVVVASITNI